MAEDKFVWCVSATKLLISEYESYEMLYDTRHTDYKNRNKRLEIYKRIVHLINTVKSGCKVDDIKKKLNGLRSQYLSEKIKVIRSIKSGAEGDDVYKPKVYWFPLLKFLDKSTEADESQSNLDLQLDHSQFLSDTYNGANEHNYNLQGDNSPETTPLYSIDAKVGTTPMVSKNKKRKTLPYDALLAQASTTMSEMTKIVKEKPVYNQTSEDAIDTFGKFVVTELRGIQGASNERIVRQAKRQIQQVLMDTWDIIDQPTKRLGSASSQESWRLSPMPNYAPSPDNLNQSYYEQEQTDDNHSNINNNDG